MKLLGNLKKLSANLDFGFYTHCDWYNQMTPFKENLGNVDYRFLRNTMPDYFDVIIEFGIAMKHNINQKV